MRRAYAGGRTLWARQDVRQKTRGVTRLLHPQVGPLDLHYEKLALPGAPGQMLVAYHAEPGSPTWERLQMLAHLAAPPPPARTDTETPAADEAAQAPDQ
ncbi:MmyB family transcriptional regulator [Streptomyces sp. NPDC004044]